MHSRKFYHWLGYTGFIIAILANSSYALVTVDDTIPLILLFVGCLSTFLTLRMRLNLSRIKLTALLVYIFCIAILFTMVTKRDFGAWGGYFRLVFVLLFAFNITQLVDFEHFCEIYIRVLKVICIITLGVYFLVNVVGVTKIFPIVQNVNDYSYYNGLIVFVQMQDTYRCMGPFWEPGILATFLVLALLFETCFLSRKAKIFNICLFLITIIFTFSTAGYVITVPIILIALNYRYSQRFSTLLNLVFFGAIFIAVFFSENIILKLADLFPDLFQKMTFESFSMMTRINSPVLDMRIWGQNLTTGVGLGQYQSDWYDLAGNYTMNSRTSTLTFFLAAFGAGGFLYTYFVLRGCMNQKRFSILMRIMLFIVIISILTKEPHYFNVLISIIIFYLCASNPNRIRSSI